MIDLTKSILPSAIEVGGSFFELHTDFQYWINFSIQIKNSDKKNATDFEFLFKNRIPNNMEEAFNELVKFAYPKAELPRMSGKGSNIIAYDWVLDADYIYAAFYQQYKIDLCDENLHLHWYKFMALFNGLKDTKFDSIVGYRFFEPGKKSDPEKEYLKLKNMWEIKYQLTDKEEEKLKRFKSYLKC